jgi:anti-anti-sigma factor
MIAGPFNIAINKGPNYAVVSPDGYINQTGGGQLADACGDLIDEGLTHLILNLTKAPIVSSVGIACLIEVIERANNGGGSVAFCGLTPVLTKTFHIMRLNEATKISVTEDDAIAAVERTNPSSPGQT